MNIAAYCRVSTDKEDQLNSLATQKQFFAEYTQRTGDTLVRQVMLRLGQTHLRDEFQRGHLVLLLEDLR